MNWYDAHCHLAKVAELYDFETTLKAAEARDIKGWLSSALSKEEVRWHQLNRSDKIRFSAGIHPVYNEGTPLTLDDLETLAKDKQLYAIGEIGLDKRNRRLDEQVKLFRDQLSLARAYDLPCVFHIVGHYDVFIKILTDMPVRGIWHGFYASREIVKQFSDFDLTFSIGKVLIDSLKHDIINAVISYGNFLIETDAPYNLKKPDKSSPDTINPLIELINYSRVVSRMNGVKLEALQSVLDKNIRQYII